MCSKRRSILYKKQQSVFIFTDEGKFIARINRLGKGANEYIDLTDFEIGEQGELIIFDAVNRRLLFSNQEFDFTRSLKVCYGDKVLYLKDGSFIIYADIPEKGGYSIHVFDRNASLNKRSFLRLTMKESDQLIIGKNI